MEATNQSLATPIKMGIILGLIYCVLIFCQNQFFFSNPFVFGLTKLVSYLIIVAGFFYSGFLAKQELGGYIPYKECLKAILIVIAITELLYLVFSTVYIKYIDPTFFEKLKSSWEVYFIANKVPADKINNSLEKFNEAGKISVMSLIQSYGFSIIIDAIFGVIIAAILRKNRPELANQI